MDTQTNPYQTPVADSSPAEESALPIISAGKGARFINLIIDYIMQIVVVILYVVIATIIGGEELANRLQTLPDMALGLMALLPYYILMESMFGRTVGKLITGTKVINEARQTPGIGQVVGRTFARLIPFEAFSFFGSESRGWHDSLAKTYVVKCR